MSKNILNKIIENKFNELEKLKSTYKDISKKINPAIKGEFKNNFINTSKVKIIAEIKPASPSEGEIFKPTKKNIKNIAAIYSKFPIGAISVLTDSAYFNGSYENIALVKEITDIPVLCKEFIVDKFQLKLAKYFGADAVLLIAEALPYKKLLSLYNFAKKINLEVLFEFHSSKNLDFLLENDIEIIGINNRNLDTMKVDINKCLTLKNHIPKHKIVIGESGFYTKEDIKLLDTQNFNGVLIGTSLLKSDDIDIKLKELVYYYE